MKTTQIAHTHTFCLKKKIHRTEKDGRKDPNLQVELIENEAKRKKSSLSFIPQQHNLIPLFHHD